MKLVDIKNNHLIYFSFVWRNGEILIMTLLSELNIINATMYEFIINYD